MWQGSASFSIMQSRAICYLRIMSHELTWGLGWCYKVSWLAVYVTEFRYRPYSREIAESDISTLFLHSILPI